MHSRTHTGEKPHVCDHGGCHKAFSDVRPHLTPRPLLNADGCSPRVWLDIAESILGSGLISAASLRANEGKRCYGVLRFQRRLTCEASAARQPSLNIKTDLTLWARWLECRRKTRSLNTHMLLLSPPRCQTSSIWSTNQRTIPVLRHPTTSTSSRACPCVQ